MLFGEISYHKSFDTFCLFFKLNSYLALLPLSVSGIFYLLRTSKREVAQPVAVGTGKQISTDA